MGRVAVREARASSRWAGLALVASGLVQVVGVASLIAMYAGFAIGWRPFAHAVGTVNDVLAMVAYPLAAPAILALRPMLRAALGAAGDVAASAGLAAIAAIGALQVLLVSGALTFETEILPVTLAFLALGACFVVVGATGRNRGLPVGPLLGVAAGLYVGYPVWAVRLGRWMAERAR